MGTHRHPEVSLHNLPLADYMAPIRAGDWDQVAELMLVSTRKLASAGADFAICPDNTIHQAFDPVVARSPIPWLHIGDGVARAARSAGYETLGLTGTKYLMTGPVYPAVLARYGMSCVIPGEADRERIDEIIFSQLVAGVFPEDSRRYFNEVFQELKDRGCDAAVMGCTEIPLLVDPEDTPLPVLDSTRLLARAALDRALTADAGR
jgi:aspartate racemase